MMFDIFNQISSRWYEIFILMTIHNSIFFLLILGVIYIFNKTDPLLLKILTTLAFIKALIPPIFSFKTSQPVSVPIYTLASDNITETSGTNELNSVNFSFESTLMTIWLIVVTFILLSAIVKYYRLYHSVSKMEFIRNEFTESLNVKEKIYLYKSDKEESPYVFGFFKQHIVLPKDWDDLSDQQKKMILSHELAHIRYKDHWINLLRVIAFTLNFFNPLLWFIVKKHNQFLEMVCDDATLRTTGCSISLYSKELIGLSSRYPTNGSSFKSSFAFSESYHTIKNRVKYHLSKKEENNMKTPKSRLFVYLFLSGLIAIPFLWKCETDEAKQRNLYRFYEVTEKPKMIHKEIPAYPEDAKQKRVQGRVVVSVLINETGEVESAEIVKGIDPVLDESALEAGKKCTFEPARIDGKPVKVKMYVPFNFEL